MPNLFFLNKYVDFTSNPSQKSRFDCLADGIVRPRLQNLIKIQIMKSRSKLYRRSPSSHAPFKHLRFSLPCGVHLFKLLPCPRALTEVRFSTDCYILLYSTSHPVRPFLGVVPSRPIYRLLSLRLRSTNGVNVGNHLLLTAIFLASAQLTFYVLQKYGFLLLDCKLSHDKVV